MDDIDMADTAEVAKSSPETGATLLAGPVKTGPAVGTATVGAGGLIATVLILMSGLDIGVDIDWGIAVPVTAVVAGLLLVGLGIAGMRGQRYRG